MSVGNDLGSAVAKYLGFGEDAAPGQLDLIDPVQSRAQQVWQINQSAGTIERAAPLLKVVAGAVGLAVAWKLLEPQKLKA